MPDHNTPGSDSGAWAAKKTSPLPLGEGPGVRAAGLRKAPNPYTQVALTYLRRPLASWPGRVAAVALVCTIVAFSLAAGAGRLHDSVVVVLMFLFPLFLFLAVHTKGQFVDSRAHLAPGFRRVHATVAAVAAAIVALLLPAAYSWLAGCHGVGLVAVVVLMFGATAWVIVKDATWTLFAILAVLTAMGASESGTTYFRHLISGRHEPHALAILGLGAFLTLLSGIRLVRLGEEDLKYDSTLRWDWDWDWSQKTREGWRDDGRILPGLRNWIREKEMARLTRLASRASVSWWSRTCRWQVGMVAGWSLGLCVLGTLVYLQTVMWWILAKSSDAVAVKAGMISLLALTIVPAMMTAVGVLPWRAFKAERELLLPVSRRCYVRQLITAAAVSHIQLWGGLSVAIVLWWLLTNRESFRPTMIAGLLALSAALQIFVFGVLVWTTRYRSKAVGVSALMAIFTAGQAAATTVAMQRSALTHESFLPGAMWIGALLAALGLFITWDAYRRWLKTDLN